MEFVNFLNWYIRVTSALLKSPYKVNNSKTVVLFIAVLAMVTSAHAQELQALDSSYLTGHYKQRLAFFRRMPSQKREIVFLGNSLTEGGKWQELVGKRRVVNRGVSGDVTYGILARLDEVLRSKPDKIFLLCGVNDMKRGFPNEIILTNIKRIVLEVKRRSPKTTLYIQSLLPVNEAMLPESYRLVKNEKIEVLNEGLKKICERQNKVVYIDLHPVFSDSNGYLKKELSIDGLHLRQASYIIWANYLKKRGLI